MVECGLTTSEAGEDAEETEKRACMVGSAPSPGERSVKLAGLTQLPYLTLPPIPWLWVHAAHIHGLFFLWFREY